MAAQNKRGMVDTRWRELQPAWGPKEHDGERQMLYDVLNDNESIESLVGCVWGPENVFRAGANRLDRMRQYDGIAVLTGRRVVLLKKKGMNKLITEMPLHNMESVDVDATGEVTPLGGATALGSAMATPRLSRCGTYKTATPGTFPSGCEK